MNRYFPSLHNILNDQFLILDLVEVSSVADDSSVNRSSVADVSSEVVSSAVICSLAENVLVEP